MCRPMSRAHRPPAASVQVASPLCVGADAFSSGAAGVPPSLCVVPGTLVNANTLEDFKDWDKAALLRQVAGTIWKDVCSGRALAEPHRLSRFLLLTFADLKTHRFYYWFAFPAFAITPPFRAKAPTPLPAVLDPAQVDALRAGYAHLAASPPADGAEPHAGAPAFFAVRLSASGGTGASLQVEEVGQVSKWAEWEEDGPAGQQAWLALCDPVPTHAGWPMRNLLVAAAAAVRRRDAAASGERSFRVLCFREPPQGAAALTAGATSALYEVTLSLDAAGGDAAPAAVGWEKNTSGRAGGRMMDLSSQMDPVAIATSSVELNIQLMRWRLMPALQPQLVASQRCLLLGAGTLGCAVARCLLGWGVKVITFVDSGTVSYSNPVRQSLFTHEECIGGQTAKAPAAAAALRRIFPGVQARGVVMGIPMPGHHVGRDELDGVRADAAALEELIASHDVVFLLTDTRESRWLPTLLATVLRKPTFTTALGFDTFLVMRHGLPPAVDGFPPATDGTSVDGGPGRRRRLGCYFCNDVVAPANSMTRRTLDQQCTVSRPGLSMVASALTVELLVTLLHHPRGPDADADVPAEARPEAQPSDGESALGVVPHQARVVGAIVLPKRKLMGGRPSSTARKLGS